MARVTDEILRSAGELVLDERAQRARVYADAAPLLFDACSAVYFAYKARKTDPRGLEAAIALAGEVNRAVWAALGYAQYAGQPMPESIGLGGQEAEKARMATEKALARLDSAKVDDSAVYYVRA